jgi:hypothetical protein
MQNTKASIATDLVEVKNVNFHKAEILCSHYSEYYHQELLKYEAVQFGRQMLKFRCNVYRPTIPLFKIDNTSKLKMRTLGSPETSVCLYQRHGVTFQNTIQDLMSLRNN